MTQVFLVSNVERGDPGGRAEKLASRARRMTDFGIETTFGHVPEPYVRTFPRSVVRLARQCRRVDADVVVSVSNPFHLQLVGYAVSRLTGCPWIVEFRDPMVTSPDRDPDAAITKIASLVERLAVRRSAHVVYGKGIQVEPGYYADTYGVPDSHVTPLPHHGFDPEAFDGVEPISYDDFRITYAGSFYDGWIEPYRFLDGLARYAGDGNSDLTVQFYGDWSDSYDRLVTDAGLDELVETHDFVPHDEVVPVLKGSDVALYVGGTDPANRRNVPSKIWDYVGARIPILALVDPTFDVADLIREHDLGIVVDPRDTDAIAEAIRRLHGGEYEYDPPESVFSRFTRDRKVERYAEIIESVAGGTD